MNKSLIEKILLFLAGGGVGTLATIFIMKPRFEKELDKQVAEIRDAIEKGYKEGKKNTPPFDPDNEDEIEMLQELSNKIVKTANEAKNKENVREILEKKGYVNYSRTNDEPTRNPVPDDEEVYVPENEDIEIIAPEEFGEKIGYELETLYYLRDKMLVDDQGNVIENPGEYIGHDALHEFGAYGEPDSVYVRNHRNKMDVEIFLRENETLANFSG